MTKSFNDILYSDKIYVELKHEFDIRLKFTKIICEHTKDDELGHTDSRFIIRALSEIKDDIVKREKILRREWKEKYGSNGNVNDSKRKKKKKVMWKY